MSRLAEREGFEPPVPFGITGFQDQRLQPLGHRSRANQLEYITMRFRMSQEKYQGNVRGTKKEEKSLIIATKTVDKRKQLCIMVYGEIYFAKGGAADDVSKRIFYEPELRRDQHVSLRPTDFALEILRTQNGTL